MEPYYILKEFIAANSKPQMVQGSTKGAGE